MMFCVRIYSERVKGRLKDFESIKGILFINLVKRKVDLCIIFGDKLVLLLIIMDLFYELFCDL